MKDTIIILYPSDFFDIKKVDPDYQYEYIEAVKFPELQIVFYNYDEFSAGGKLKIYPSEVEKGLCIYRGWMLQPEKYRELYLLLRENGLNLINTPEEYENCHEFPNSYPLIRDFTPGIRAFKKGEVIDWDQLKREYKRFFMKDYVKSVKGTDFPAYFDASYSNEFLNEYVEKFIEMRGSLFVKGIVLKEFVELKKNGEVTNEYRGFYLDGSLLTLSRNSNQTEGNSVPQELLNSLPVLKSRFYTVDFAELDNDQWIVIETGDGQVSGLPPGQFVFKYYEELLTRLKDGE
jgi:hypothetical protein